MLKEVCCATLVTAQDGILAVFVAFEAETFLKKTSWIHVQVKFFFGLATALALVEFLFILLRFRKFAAIKETCRIVPHKLTHRLIWELNVQIDKLRLLLQLLLLTYDCCSSYSDDRHRII